MMAKERRDPGIDGNTAKTMAAVYSPMITVGGGASLYAGNKIYKKTNLKYRKGLMDDLLKMKNIANNPNPGEFMGEYTRLGNKLMNETVDYGGRKYTSHDLVKKVRTGTIGEVLEKINIMGKYKPKESAAHYGAFVKSQDDAIRKVMSEIWTGPDAIGGNVNFYKGVRRQAAENLINRDVNNITQNALASEAAKIMAANKGATRQEHAHMLRSILRTEKELQSKNPTIYKTFNKYISKAFRGNDPKATRILDRASEKLFRDTGYNTYGMDRIIRNTKANTPDVVTGVANVDMARSFRNVVNKGYGKIHGVMSSIKNVNRVGKKLMIGGGLAVAGGLGLGAYGLHRSGTPRNPQNKQ